MLFLSPAGKHPVPAAGLHSGSVRFMDPFLASRYAILTITDQALKEFCKLACVQVAQKLQLASVKGRHAMFWHKNLYS